MDKMKLPPPMQPRPFSKCPTCGMPTRPTDNSGNGANCIECAKLAKYYPNK